MNCKMLFWISSRSFVYRKVLSSIILLFLLVSCQLDDHAEEILIMTYNVQNLFDSIKNGYEYPEYATPFSQYSIQEYRAKLKAVSQAIKTGDSRGPDILALQEIENQKVINDLLRGELEHLGYHWPVIVPVAGSATNTALLSRFPVERVHVHNLPDYKGQTVRPVMEFEIRIKTKLLILFNNHWKSKSGGSQATESSRREAAAIVSKRCQYWQNLDPNSRILIIGDFNEQGFNCYPKESDYLQGIMNHTSQLSPSLQKKSILTTGESRKLSKEKKWLFFDPYLDNLHENKGSYAFRGNWLAYDKILMNQAFFNKKDLEYKDGSFNVIKNKLLLNRKGFPRAWNRDSFQGFSDHLPVIARFIWMDAYQGPSDTSF